MLFNCLIYTSVYVLCVSLSMNNQMLKYIPEIREILIGSYSMYSIMSI